MHRLRTIGGGRSLIRRSAPPAYRSTIWQIGRRPAWGVHVLLFNHNHLRPDSDQKMTRKRNFRGQHLSFPGASPKCHCHALYIVWFYYLNSKLDFSRSKWFWWFRLTSVAPLTISEKELLKHAKYFLNISKYRNQRTWHLFSGFMGDPEGQLKSFAK